MIFGKKTKKIAEEKEHNWFAWRPVILVDGRWAWLQFIYKEWWSCFTQCGYSYYISKKAASKKVL